MKFELDTSIPVNFSSLEPDDDPRFLRGKIWVCHVGQNLNNTVFSKDVITKAIPSLANIPVLGFIKVDEDQEKDFMGHEERLVYDEKDGFKIKYMGHMYGIVPESNNAKFEIKKDEYGVEREYLTTEVILHTKFKDSIDIISKDGVVNHSMELHPDSIKGNFDKKTKLFEFTDFKFEGLCLLGEDVKPAMTGSVLEVFSKFSVNSATEEIANLLKEFNSYFSQKNQEKLEEGGIMPVKEKLDLIATYTNLTDEEVKDFKENLDSYTVDELKQKLDEVESTKQPTEPETAPPVVVDPNDNPNEDDREPTPEGNPEQPNPVTNFALTVEQKREAVLETLSTSTYVDSWGDTEIRFYYMDMDENRVYAMDAANGWKAVGIDYTMQGDQVFIDFDSAKVIKFMPVDLEEGEVSNFSVGEVMNQVFEKISEKEKNKHEEIVKNFEAALEKKDAEMNQTLNQLNEIETKFTEVNRLYSEKIEKENMEKLQELYSSFSKELTAEEIEEVKSKNENASYEDIQLKLYATLGMKKAKFTAHSSVKNAPIINLNNQAPEEDLPTKSYDRLAQKYLKNKNKQSGGNK